MYITYWNPPKTRQISFEEILAGVTDISNLSRGGDNTFDYDDLSRQFNSKIGTNYKHR